ncbi:hypothetical protein ACLOJK_005907 [Asimina triloba]
MYAHLHLRQPATHDGHAVQQLTPITWASHDRARMVHPSRSIQRSHEPAAHEPIGRHELHQPQIFASSSRPSRGPATIPRQPIAPTTRARRPRSSFISVFCSTPLQPHIVPHGPPQICPRPRAAPSLAPASDQRPRPPQQPMADLPLPLDPTRQQHPWPTHHPYPAASMMPHAHDASFTDRKIRPASAHLTPMLDHTWQPHTIPPATNGDNTIPPPEDPPPLPLASGAPTDPIPTTSTSHMQATAEASPSYAPHHPQCNHMGSHTLMTTINGEVIEREGRDGEKRRMGGDPDTVEFVDGQREARAWAVRWKKGKLSTFLNIVIA